MNSFEFKPPKDRQTDTGDSGEAPQHFPIENFFSTMISFFTSNLHTQTDRHIVQTATYRQTYRQKLDFIVLIVYINKIL